MKLLLIIFSFLLLTLFSRLWIGQGSYPDVWYLEKKIKQQEEANEKQIIKNKRLSAELKDLQVNGDVIEEYARDELGMIRKGETFYQVILEKEVDRKQAHAKAQ